MNWDNYDDVLDQMREAGLVVDSIEVGRMRRCKVEGDREKRGWYMLHELRLDDGAMVLVGSFGCWRGADAGTIKVELKKRTLTAEQRAALKKRIADDHKAGERIRKAGNAKAALLAQKAWAIMAHDGTSAYLKRKGIQGYGVRFARKGDEIIVPMLDTSGRVHGLQRIYGEKKAGRDKDFWPAGLAKQGHFFLMGPQPTTVLLVAEGYATAASLHEASGWPVAVAFDAGNLAPVADALKKRYPRTRILLCADDDFLTDGNPGISKASAAALAVSGAWVAPVFAADRGDKKITDFNDLHALEGLHQVRSQIEAKLRQLGWLDAAPRVPAPAAVEGEGGGASTDLRAVETTEELQDRFSLVYEMPETAYDAQEAKLVPLASVRNICSSRQISRTWMESSTKRIVRTREVGFDPSGKDPQIRCNLWGGWPTQPKQGDCDTMLELLYHLCKGEANADEVYAWVLKWLAYPIQYPGTKMKTALVFHGPQGVGKNIFFEAIMAIYGEYGRIIDQAAIEDKFNDWASRKLFLIADEVVARAEIWHTKNKLKGIITGEWIRINPKNMGAYDEKNHVNLVFLSNESRPLVLERDDRRYTVVYTPEKLDPQFYETVRLEMETGGIDALHHYLKTLPLGDFKPWTAPPATRAKDDLIKASMDSSEQFWNDWLERTLPLPVGPARSEDLFAAYRQWCTITNSRAPSLNTFISETSKRRGCIKARKRNYVAGAPTPCQSTVIFPNGDSLGDEIHALSLAMDGFKDSLTEWSRSLVRLAA